MGLRGVSSYGVYLFFAAVLTVSPVDAQMSPDMRGEDGPAKIRSAISECEPSAVSYQDNPNLTRQEKIARMDEALMASLNRYDECQPIDPSKSAAAGGGGGGGGGGSSSDGATSGASVATSGMRGTERSLPPKPSPELLSKANSGSKTFEGDQTDAVERTNPRVNNGKVPEDIPPTDNDSVLEAQIRQAALNETNPEIKKQLWNEYRKYKGLPTVR